VLLTLQPGTVQELGFGAVMFNFVQNHPCNVSMSNARCSLHILIKLALFVLYDQESLSTDAMLQAVLSDQSISPNQGVQANNEFPNPMHSHICTRAGIEDDMDMDIDDSNNPTSSDGEMETSGTQHPLDELHEQVVTHFTDLLRDTAQRAAVVQTEQNAKVGKGLRASRHAPKFGEAGMALPTAFEISKFTCSECIQLLSILSPQAFLTDGQQVYCMAKPKHYEFVRLANFLTLPYNPGARRGRDWTREDWRDALTLLDKSASYWQDTSTCESCSICRPVMENVFQGLDT
jgi:hypothetical protein